MDIEKFTERARGFLQAAQTIAIREFNQRLTPEHLLKALLDDEEGAAAGLINAAGGNAPAAKQGADAEVARLPKVQGSGAGQPQGSPDLVRLLDAAQQAAVKAGDEFVAQDRLLLALATGETPAARVLRGAGATAQALEKAVADLRRGRKVDSPNAEAG
ncbi:MAG: ATP-dependent chaperone ClpB, partial [Gemmatimonadaceae bacterium]|nr:ATP-dependent chaperone ClpB [Acetobacteraceae bacterium]